MVPVGTDTPPIPVLCANGAGILVNREVIDAVGYLVEPRFFAHADDMDLGLRVNAAGYQILLAPRSVVYHDTEWHWQWNMRNLRRAFWVTQNTILAFFKVSYPSEFIQLLPRLLLGKVLKAGQHCRTPLGRIAYGLAAFPVALVALAGALAKMPSFRERRRMTLDHRNMEPGWLVERLLQVDRQPDPTVWTGQRQHEARSRQCRT
jgi:GT2 family glycosyltransferase